MKIDLTSGQQHNLELALLPLGEHRPFNLCGMAVAGCVLHLDRTAASQLDAVVEDGARGQAVGSKAGTRVIDLEQLNRCAGAVFDRGIHVIRVATGSQPKHRQENCGQNPPMKPASRDHSRSTSATWAPSGEAWAATFFSTRSRRLSSSGRR